MKGLVIFLLTLAVIASLSFIAISRKNINDTRAEAIKKPEILNFSTFTSAVCQNNGDAVHCKDEVFVKCNDKISKAVDSTECNGIKIGVSQATGAAVFGHDWRDPRN